ncbi:endoplasmic reticulum metallopeptidase 1-like isoform X2 [Planococcus citri]|uniref:endoplasmic reticulum metallopeptidase 1-like isoform X2 n=1 Tax=Planococcus citri TaxID=170843 RepID=UPI0031F817B2
MEIQIEADPSPQLVLKPPESRKTIPVIVDKQTNTIDSEAESQSTILKPHREMPTEQDVLAYNKRQTELQAILNTKFFVAVFLAAIILMVIASWALNSCPKGLTEDELDPANTNRVSGVRAMEYLKELDEIGPKPIGSYENEVLTVDYLLCQIERIKKREPPSWNGIDIDIQVVSGNFSEVDSRGRAFRKQIVYGNLQNVVVKLYSKFNATESILVNCHFDSSFASPGTSDGGLNCAVMLEVLLVMSIVDHPIRRNVIFLFNGAKVDGISGSHGFITKHKWINEIVCFINLDAFGAGGRQTLFQTGPNAYVLPKIYSKSAMFPDGKVLSEEFIQSGLLPSDTDFKIFRDYGQLKGLDLVHFANGYVYQTSSDNISMITANVLQLAGDNLLHTVKALVDYNFLKEELQSNDEQAVYFDIFGLFIVCYPSIVGFLINLVVVIISTYASVSLLFQVFKGKPVKMILQHVLIDLLFVVIGIVAVTLVLYLLATLLKVNDATMLWYSKPWFILTYYGGAVFLIMFTVLKIRRTFMQSLLNREQEVRVFVFVIQFTMTVILLLATLSGIRSSFILAIGLIGVSISRYFFHKTNLRLEIVERKFFVYFMINFLPALYCACIFIPFVQWIIPILGRMGADYNAEDVIWIIAEVTILITFAYVIPLVLLVKEFWTMQYMFAAIYIVQLILVLTQALSPFSDSTPQRFYAMHVDRKLAHSENTSFKNESSGYLVTTVDVHGGETLEKFFKQHQFQQLAHTDECTRELFCGMPTLESSFLLKLGLSFWAPKEVPKIPHFKKMNYSVIDDGHDMVTFHLTLNGSKFMDAIILPLNEAKLVLWSFNPPIPGNELKWNGQSAYFIRYHEGSLNQSSLSFSLKFDVRKMHNKDAPVFKLAWSVFYPSNSSDNFTRQFKTFIDGFPSWSTVVPMVAEYEEYLLPADFSKNH